MQAQALLAALNDRISNYDLLCHPFYRAWSAGQLTRDDLRDYAADYYHHVAAFPTYLSALHSRLPDGPTRRRILANLAGEELAGTPHSELWLDFAEGVGANRDAVRAGAPIREVQDAIAWFRATAAESSTAEALAAFWAYESQVPRIAAAKEQGLREWYAADDKTSAYFSVHKTADLHHARTWEILLAAEVARQPAKTERALDSAEHAAQKLWHVLDGMETRRLASVA
jgi:pyrroloquinoline-quinone synthase